ncbi:MAG: replication initiator protein A [Lachnospiraceae bacterium]|nr:replication initiator protein A [Lachnospiraceae bacterium]
MAKYDIEFDYYHGYESEQFAFYRIPKVLFTDDYFKDLSSDAKVLYGLMLDRMSLSVKNQWIDENERVYIIFTLEQVMQYMNCGKDKGVKILAELDTGKGIGLIERVKRGLGRPDIIYVKSFLIKERQAQISSDAEENTADDDGEEQKDKTAEVKGSEKPKSGLWKNRNQEFGKTEVSESENPKSISRKNRSLESGKTESISSEKPKSGVRKDRSTKFGKIDSNNTDKNKNEGNNTNLIYLSGKEQENRAGDRMDVMSIIQAYTDIVKRNIDYDTLVRDCRDGDREYIDEIVDLLVETISINRETIVIGGAEYPYQFVKNKLLKVDASHIQYVLECLHDTTTKVHNVKAYLLTCLFNAPSTIGNYYRVEVNHDMYG